jgi:hypothetical protein
MIVIIGCVSLKLDRTLRPRALRAEARARLASDPLAHRKARAHAIPPTNVRIASLVPRDTSLPGWGAVRRRTVRLEDVRRSSTVAVRRPSRNVVADANSRENAPYVLELLRLRGGSHHVADVTPIDAPPSHAPVMAEAVSH